MEFCVCVCISFIPIIAPARCGVNFRDSPRLTELPVNYGRLETEEEIVYGAFRKSTEISKMTHLLEQSVKE